VTAYAKKFLDILHVHEIDPDSDLREKERKRESHETMRKKELKVKKKN
jgi:hypothetical protein